MPDQFKIVFKPSGRGKAECPPDPQFPDGITMSMASEGGPSCTIQFPYPAPECGHWRAECARCGFRIAVTAAGRVDDPRALTVPCHAKAESN